MTLLPTQPTPRLSLPLTSGGTTDDLQLGTGSDGRFSLVVFFRGLHCPVCRKQLGEIERRREELTEAGIGRLVAVSMETEDRSRQLVDEWGVSVPVAHGLDEDAAREWGLFLSRAVKEGEPEVFSEPGMFVLDSDGTLFWSSVASMPFSRPSLDEVMAGLRFAQDQDYPARGAA